MFAVQVPIRGSLILSWIKKQLQWKRSENSHREEMECVECKEIVKSSFFLWQTVNDRLCVMQIWLQERSV